MKHILALLLAAMLLFGCACAEQVSGAPIATYILPEGAQAQHLWYTGGWESPEGLQEMYRIMQNAGMENDVYLVRMKNGRALVSISCMPLEHQRTPEELAGMWPRIALGIGREGVSVDASGDCVSVEDRFGHQALCIDTTIGLNQDEILLDADAFAFVRGSEFLEVWAVAPVEGTYAPEDPAAQQLADDRADMAQFLSSLQFDGLESMQMEGVPYTDPDGRFSMLIPAGSTVLTHHSAQENIDRAREAYLAAHEAGADRFFDEYIKDVNEQRVTVIITADQQNVIEIFASQEENFRGATTEQLSALAQPIGQSLAEKFDLAACLMAGEQAPISGYEHAWLGYWLRSGEADVQLDVLAAVLDDAWLYEVDLFTHNGDQEKRSLQMLFITQTLQYTPLANALSE